MRAGGTPDISFTIFSTSELKHKSAETLQYSRMGLRAIFDSDGKRGREAAAAVIALADPDRHFRGCSLGELAGSSERASPFFSLSDARCEIPRHCSGCGWMGVLS